MRFPSIGGQPDLEVNLNEAWHSYMVLIPGEPRDFIRCKGLLTNKEIHAKLGGDFEFIETHDHMKAVWAVRKDRDRLPVNEHFEEQVFHGPVIMGKYAPDRRFVGMLLTP